jgi:acyl-CoA reductase-like NAD-dependent aldehyde dehydrogenase
MGVTRLPIFVAGKAIQPGVGAPVALDLDRDVTLPTAEVTPALMREAIRYAEASQAKLAETTMAERLATARLVLRAYAARRADVAWGLARFRGQVERDTAWMCDLVARWADELDDFLRALAAGEGDELAYEVTSSYDRYGKVRWTSRGVGALFCAATMDGPAAVTALCHGILSGTHIVMRPSWRDAVTHFAFETLHEHGLDHYAQLVRWRTDAPDAPTLGKILLTQAAQGLIFSSNETYATLLSSVAESGSEGWQELARKCRRYGTGLPLNVVTPGADLAAAARDLVAGARLGGGRFCLSTTPVVVVGEVYDALVDAVVAEAKKLRGGALTDPATELGRCDPDELNALKAGLATFGGDVAYGDLHASHMDVVVLRDVPKSSPSLYRELPITTLALIPVATLEEGAQIARFALRRNHREAWTAVSVHGDEAAFATIARGIPSYRYLRGGIVAEGKLLLPHQGTYFALDLMRRVTHETYAPGATTQRSRLTKVG